MRFSILMVLLVGSFISLAQVQKIAVGIGDSLDFPSDFINESGIPVGEDFPDYSLEDINGNTISSKDLQGKLVIYNFWFVGCYGCHKEEPYLEEIAANYSDREDVVFISFCNSSDRRSRRYIQKKGAFGYAVIPVKKGKVCEELFKVASFPTNMIVKDGEVLQNVGFPMWNEVLDKWFRHQIESRL